MAGIVSIRSGEMAARVSLYAGAIVDATIGGVPFLRPYPGDYFCFEPMSHSADAHHHADLGGLRVLAPGETLSGTVIFRPQPLPSSPGARP